MPNKIVFAGHGQKSLTVETTHTGIVHLWVVIGDDKHLITLLPSEARELATAVTQSGQTTQIVKY